MSIQTVNSSQILYQGNCLGFQTTSSLFIPSYSRIESASNYSDESFYRLCLYNNFEEGEEVDNTFIAEISVLEQYTLKNPIRIKIRKDGDGYLATVENLPNYFYAELKSDVIKGIKIDIEDLYEELNELNPRLIKGKWKEHKDYLNSIIISEK